MPFSIYFLLKAKYGLGETKLICWSRYPTDPILSKTKQIILENVSQQALLIYFLIFEKKERIKT